MPKKPLKNIRTSAVSRGFSLTKLGLSLGTQAAEHVIGNLFTSKAGQKIREKSHLVRQMAVLAKELGELKGSLMKVGQMLSVHGEHFLPPEANQILKSLQSESATLEWTEIRKVLMRALGKEKFAELEINHEPVAAASLAQVHEAKIIATGEKIALKVQYPGVNKAIDGDVRTLKKVLRFMEWLPKIPATEELFEEIQVMLHQELDYKQELEMLLYFRGKLEGDARYVVPRPYPEYCSGQVLAMSFEHGVTVDSQEVLSLSQERRNALAVNALDLYFRELYLWRHVQTDPHFGNYRIRVGKSGNDQIVLFDFGATRKFSKEFMDKYRALLRGAFYDDRPAFEDAAVKLKVLEHSDPQELKDIFYHLCSMIVEPFAKHAPFDWKNNDLPKEVVKVSWDMIKRFPMRSPPRELVFLDRKMAGIFTFMSVLGAKFNAREVLAPYLQNK